jgi:hypothetical protein
MCSIHKHIICTISAIEDMKEEQGQDTFELGLRRDPGLLTRGYNRLLNIPSVWLSFFFGLRKRSETLHRELTRRMGTT